MERKLPRERPLRLEKCGRKNAQTSNQQQKASKRNNSAQNLLPVYGCVLVCCLQFRFQPNKHAKQKIIVDAALSFDLAPYRTCPDLPHMSCRTLSFSQSNNVVQSRKSKQNKQLSSQTPPAQSHFTKWQGGAMFGRWSERRKTKKICKTRDFFSMTCLYKRKKLSFAGSNK
jgi:hypothetical protein